MACETCGGTGEIPLLGAATTPCPDCEPREIRSKWNVEGPFEVDFSHHGETRFEPGGTLTFFEDGGILYWGPDGAELEGGFDDTRPRPSKCGRISSRKAVISPVRIDMH